MARTDNLDDFIKRLSKLEGKVDTAVIREARKNMRATIRKFKPMAKAASPKATGALIKSIKVKSRSRKGVSTVTLTWAVPYAGPQNFIKAGENEKFATNLYDQQKEVLERQGTKDVR
ncbi:MAG: HK97 gp10 family phage protein, partial [Thiotrichaceae bacterium]